MVISDRAKSPLLHTPPGHRKCESFVQGNSRRSALVAGIREFGRPRDPMDDFDELIDRLKNAGLPFASDVVAT